MYRKSIKTMQHCKFPNRVIISSKAIYYLRYCLLFSVCSSSNAMKNFIVNQNIFNDMRRYNKLCLKQR